ncbi:hypothetical protein QBC43DRAFT_339715 [Cladorrhinum sp. PSN259]|nr:hypothetical protein QBC43DRAFT_339715 [Cladorrhinum sp. PSN259]
MEQDNEVIRNTDAINVNPDPLEADAPINLKYPEVAVMPYGASWGSRKRRLDLAGSPQSPKRRRWGDHKGKDKGGDDGEGDIDGDDDDGEGDGEGEDEGQGEDEDEGEDDGEDDDGEGEDDGEGDIDGDGDDGEGDGEDDDGEGEDEFIDKSLTLTIETIKLYPDPNLDIKLIFYWDQSQRIWFAKGKIPNDLPEDYIEIWKNGLKGEDLVDIMQAIPIVLEIAFRVLGSRKLKVAWVKEGYFVGKNVKVAMDHMILSLQSLIALEEGDAGVR